ncbi:carbohydrate ABC transporter permease [Occultella gossypii]|uniref:Sugar ABC transporter permease n=1 Tax=Occultella gossypii TaxID=2800820 RepID=A0ABS7S6R9_9MICO|nr:sugar ABC transporter permease [Occultella gossypii]MBZ2195430.1 sugar ABC transporter permease [Occultella gossypii]
MMTVEAPAPDRLHEPPTQRRRMRRIPPWLLPLLPVLLLIAGLLIWPMVQALVESVSVDGQWSTSAYEQVLGDAVFQQALRYTLVFTAATIALELLLGFGAASLLDGMRARTRKLLTAALMLPYLIAPVAAGLIWRLMLDYSIGTINWGLGLVGIEAVNWLGSASPAFWATVLSEVWRSTPFVLIILLAGMAAMPTDVLEAARVDGASRAQVFAFIKLPLLRPAIAVALLFQTIFKLRLFELPFILTGGGPGNSTTPLGLLVHQYYFRYANTATASVVSVVLLVLGAVIAFAYIRWVYREVDA